MFAITPRLMLRPPWPEDAQQVFDAANEERIVRNLAQLPWPYRPEDAADYCATAGDDPLPHLLIFDRLAARPRLLGTCALDDKDHGVMLGYWIRSDSWNRGYASEAGKALVAMARALGHNQLTATHFVDNPASGAVLRNIGFRETGQIEQRWSEARQSRAPARHYRWHADEQDMADEDQMPARCLMEKAAA